MYELNDTIVAVSSPMSEQRVIVRITGSNTINTLQQVFRPKIPKDKAGLMSGSIAVDGELRIDAKLYLFLAPRSYTGETIAEIHIYTNPGTTEALMAGLLAKGLRMAGPGEFTARSYLYGKIDLAQAEAVGEIVASSNKLQLAAAEKLLAGRLGQTIAKTQSSIIDCLGLIEAGLDFSGEDIEFITREDAVKRLAEIKTALKQLLAAGISYESVIDLPAIGIAGAPNAGKSTLLNKLLGQQRSIVSKQRKTTRDVLTTLYTLSHSQCILFDCAGLIAEPDNILDELAQQAAVAALQNASVVVFCIDISKTNWSEDIAIHKLIEPKATVSVATKSDLLTEDILASRIAELNELFGANFLAISTKTNSDIGLLRETIDKKLISLPSGKFKIQNSKLEIPRTSWVALTARHKQAVSEAIENITESIDELKAGNYEVTAMMLRAVYQAISGIEQQPIDEQILERIFSNFCIGK